MWYFVKYLLKVWIYNIISQVWVITNSDFLKEVREIWSLWSPPARTRLAVPYDMMLLKDTKHTGNFLPLKNVALPSAHWPYFTPTEWHTESTIYLYYAKPPFTLSCPVYIFVYQIRLTFYCAQSVSCQLFLQVFYYASMLLCFSNGILHRQFSTKWNGRKHVEHLSPRNTKEYSALVNGFDSKAVKYKRFLAS